jgi:hypothetical protein
VHEEQAAMQDRGLADDALPARDGETEGQPGLGATQTEGQDGLGATGTGPPAGTPNRVEPD